MAAVNESPIIGFPTANILLSAITADRKWNSRQHYEPVEKADGGGKEDSHANSIEGLAEDIAARGLIAPLIVQSDGKGGYKLVVGFRRFEALGLVSKMEKAKGKPYAGTQTAPCKILDGTDELDALLYNLRENVQRKDLTTYDLAVRCKRLVDDHKLSGSDVGKIIGKDRTYVNHLVSRLTYLHRSILDAWADPSHAKHGLCTTANLNKLEAFKDKNGKPDHDAQVKHWAELGGETQTGSGNGGGGGNPPTPPAHKRPTVNKLAAALAALKAGVEGLSKADRETAIACLSWAAGTGRSPKLRLSGVTVFDPERKPNATPEGDDAD